MNGLAFGGGNELAMACTARIAKKGQKVFVGQPEPTLGIIPGAGGTQRLPRLVGIENAWPILRNGNPISSAQAKEIGLIQEEVEGDLIETAIDLGQKYSLGKSSCSTHQEGSYPHPFKTSGSGYRTSQPKDRFSSPEGHLGGRKDDPR